MRKPKIIYRGPQSFVDRLVENGILPWKEHSTRDRPFFWTDGTPIRAARMEPGEDG